MRKLYGYGWAHRVAAPSAEETAREVLPSCLFFFGRISSFLSWICSQSLLLLGGCAFASFRTTPVRGVWTVKVVISNAQYPSIL